MVGTGRIRGAWCCVEPRVDPENDLAALLRRQDGVVSRAQALACGLTRAAIDHRLARGLWILLWPCVYLSAAHSLGPRVRVRAASLWPGPTATLLGAGAAWWLRLLDDPPGVLRFAVPPERRVRSRGDLRVVRRLLTGRRCTVDASRSSPAPTPSSTPLPSWACGAAPSSWTGRCCRGA
jgi:hypothetical protein